jgi:hypothetical protein
MYERHTVSSRFLRIAAFVLVGGCLASYSFAADFSHSWRPGNFAMCEGIGIHGAFSVHVGGRLEAKANGDKVITSLRVWASSAAFNLGEGSVSASAQVTGPGNPPAKTVLSRPTHSVIEPSPKPGETRILYLPKDKTLTVPKGGELFVEAAAIVKQSGGTCGLGSGRDKVPLP